LSRINVELTEPRISDSRAQTSSWWLEMPITTLGSTNFIDNVQVNDVLRVDADEAGDYTITVVAVTV
jgi:hypothetical protein